MQLIDIQMIGIFNSINIQIWSLVFDAFFIEP